MSVGARSFFIIINHYIRLSVAKVKKKYVFRIIAYLRPTCTNSHTYFVVIEMREMCRCFLIL